MNEIFNKNNFLSKFSIKRQSFYDIQNFPWLKCFEDNFENIRREFDELEIPEGFFLPWVEKNLYEGSRIGGWLVAPLILNGNYINSRLKYFPTLLQLFNENKGIITALFSIIKPGTWIIPHKGYEKYSEKILRFHLGLKVPSGDIGIKVNDIQKKWKEGHSIIFDDSLIHEAWNYSEEDRIVLIFDFIKDKETDTSSNIIKELILRSEVQEFINQGLLR